ncbi:Purple acid phosphatase 5 [Raphanus sativus]|nr:Purple acid phosphatase 5 [Raphanus sativus]
MADCSGSLAVVQQQQLSLHGRSICSNLHHHCITIGDGGNIEGIANDYTYPQPSYSAYREASFGHALLEIKNMTHALYTWHMNQDNEPVIADSFWVKNKHFLLEEE